MKTIVFLISILSSQVLYAGDVLTLMSGQSFDGAVKRIKKCSILFEGGGDVFEIPAEEIYSLVFEDPENKVYVDYIEMIAEGESKCLLGTADADQYHGKAGVHFLLGVLFGPFAMIGTAVADVTPYTGKSTMMMSKNKEHFSDYEYLQCYRRKAKGKLIGMEGLGWASWVLFILIL